MSASKSRTRKSEASSPEEHPKRPHKSTDIEEDEDFLYVPDVDDPTNLQKVTSSKYPEIKKYLNLDKPGLQRWLRHNAQLVTGRKHDLLLRCIDGQINGRLLPCTKCQHGRLQYDYAEGDYVCNGYFDKMARAPIHCGHRETKPKRDKWHDLERDPAVDREKEEAEDSETASGHHKENPEHHHEHHQCKVEANHPLVDLLEDLAFFHSIVKDDKWNYKARAFKTAARAIEDLDFEIKDADALNPKDAQHHINRIGQGSYDVIKAYLENGKTSPQLQELQRQAKAKHQASKV